MAMPNPFQKLKHGVLLCKKNFNTFVETFNFLVDFAQNIMGDGDANGNGTIVFDRSVPDRPVIRSKINMAYPFGGASLYKGCFEIKRGAVGSGGFDNPYFLVGTKVYSVAGAHSIGFAYTNCIVVLGISISNEDHANPDGFITTASDLNALKTMQENEPSRAYYPLYQVDANGDVVCDFRAIPTFSVWEY